MSLKFKHWPNIIPMLIILYFPLNHYRLLIGIPFSEVLFPLIYIYIVLLIFVGTAIKKPNITTIVRNLYLFYLYLGFQIVILILISFFSINVYSSILQSASLIVSLGLTFTFFYLIQYFYLRNIKWRVFWEYTSIAFLISIIIAELFVFEIPEGYLRFTGGINPNQIAFYVLYFLLQSHLNALLNNKWSKKQKLVWLLSIIIILWTMSRTTILAVSVIYLLYFTYFFIIKSPNYIKNGINIKKTAKIMVSLIVIFFALCLWIPNSNIYEVINERITNTENVDSRSDAWKVVLTSFQKSPLIGGYGWGGSNDALSLISGVPHKTHSFFVRMLSDIGLIGMMTLVSLPVVILILLIKSKDKVRLIFQNEIVVYLFVSLFSLFFVAQIFEDRYLIELFVPYSDVIIWFMSFALIIHHVGTQRINIKS